MKRERGGRRREREEEERKEKRKKRREDKSAADEKRERRKPKVHLSAAPMAAQYQSLKLALLLPYSIFILLSTSPHIHALNVGIQSADTTVTFLKECSRKCESENCAGTLQLSIITSSDNHGLRVMTYEDDTVVPELKLKMDDGAGDYVRLGDDIVEIPVSPKKRGSFYWWWWWSRIVLLCIFAIAVGIVFLIWVGPFLLNKEVVPVLDWEIRTFSPQVLGVLLFITLALFPSILLPSTPSIWVAGITFGYGFGFFLILPGMTVGMSLPYFIGSCFRHKMQTWLEKWPEKAAFMRLAGEGSWFHQFRAVVLLRISPFPCIIYNYAAVATNVKYCPYILGSVVGVIPEIFVAIYSGILIRQLADASQSHQYLSPTQIIYNGLGFITTVATTVAITIYAKRALKKLKNEEEQLLE